MKTRTKIYLKAILLVIGLSCVAIGYWYGGSVSHPGRRFNTNEDALKNYYTVQYHVLYDSSAWHFSGMNYPYGDQVVFTDNQPVFANLLRFIHQHHIINLKGHIIAIMNLAMLAGIVLAAVFLCLIFLEWDVAWWYAAFASVGIAFLSPQLVRFCGHYALSYAFYIPMLWYAWLLYFKKPHLWRSGLIFIIILGASFIHLYYLPIGMFLGLGLWLFYYARHRPAWQTMLLNVFIQIILPLIVVKLWLVLTDPVTDRPTSPYGFMAYRSFWEGIFLPVNMQLGSLIGRFIMPIRPLGLENINYIGLAADIVMGVIIFRFFKKLFTWKWRDVLPLKNDRLTISFLAGFVILLFSLGLPFLAHLEWLLDYTGPFKQFRSVGRFAWVFYYVINVYAFTWFFQRRGARWQILFLILPLVLIVYDNFQFNRQVSGTPDGNSLSPNQKLPFNPADYQAILPLPYFYIGAESVSMENRCGSFGVAADISLATGLPMTASEMSRTSYSESMKSMALALEEYRPLRIVGDFKSQKPFLLTVPAGCELHKGEQQWLTKATELGSVGQVKFYSLSLDSIRHAGESRTGNTPCATGNTASPSGYRYVSFDSLSAGQGYQNGGIASLPGKDLVLYDAAPGLAGADSLTVSFWFNAAAFHNDMPRYSAIEFSKANAVVLKTDCGIGDNIKAMDGDWMLVEHTFPLKNLRDRLVIRISNNSPDTGMQADELLIRNPMQNVCFTKGNSRFVNDRFYLPGRP